MRNKKPPAISAANASSTSSKPKLRKKQTKLLASKVYSLLDLVLTTHRLLETLNRDALELEHIEVTDETGRTGLLYKARTCIDYLKEFMDQVQFEVDCRSVPLVRKDTLDQFSFARWWGEAVSTEMQEFLHPPNVVRVNFGDTATVH